MHDFTFVYILSIIYRSQTRIDHFDHWITAA